MAMIQVGCEAKPQACDRSRTLYSTCSRNSHKSALWRQKTVLVPCCPMSGSSPSLLGLSQMEANDAIEILKVSQQVDFCWPTRSLGASSEHRHTKEISSHGRDEGD